MSRLFPAFHHGWACGIVRFAGDGDAQRVVRSPSPKDWSSSPGSTVARDSIRVLTTVAAILRPTGRRDVLYEEPAVQKVLDNAVQWETPRIEGLFALTVTPSSCSKPNPDIYLNMILLSVSL